MLATVFDYCECSQEWLLILDLIWQDIRSSMLGIAGLTCLIIPRLLLIAYVGLLPQSP